MLNEQREIICCPYYSAVCRKSRKLRFDFEWKVSETHGSFTKIYREHVTSIMQVKVKATNPTTYLRSFDFSHELLLLTLHEFLQLFYLLLELALQLLEALGLLGFDHCSFLFCGGQIRFDTFQLLSVLRENTVNNRHSIGLYCSGRPGRSSRKRKIASRLIEGGLCDYHKRIK